MTRDPLRVYLLAGLSGHELLWEALERRQRPQRTVPVTPRPGGRLFKAVKLVILAGLGAQTRLPDILPITADARALRLVGALLFTIGLTVAVLGRLQLGAQWSDIEDGSALRHPLVVDKGIYRYVGHPIHGGDLLLLLGVQSSVHSWLVLGLVPIVGYVLWRVRREEAALARTRVSSRWRRRRPPRAS